jgi:hypothetical protein
MMVKKVITAHKKSRRKGRLLIRNKLWFYDFLRRRAIKPIKAQPIIAAEVGSGAAMRPPGPPKVNVWFRPGPEP